MELSYGKNITLATAQRLGILSAAEGLVREGPDKPWEVIVPADVPVQQSGGGVDKQTQAGEVEMAEEKQHNVSLYRAMHHLNKGGLHRALGVQEGEPIPADKLAAAKHSKNEHVQHMANFAATMKGFGHK